MSKKLIKDDDINKELLGAIVHYLLEEDRRKSTKRGNSLLVKIELDGPLGNHFEIDGEVGNADYIVTSLRFFDTKTTIEKERGQWVQSSKPNQEELTKESEELDQDEPTAQ